MLKIFVKGLVFGFGLIISIIVVGYVVTSFDFFRPTATSVSAMDIESWNSLGDNEKIQKASAIIVIRYKQEEEGLMSAYLEEILKKDPSIEVGAKVGERVESSDYYTRPGMGQNRDGAVMFLSGSPARERSTRYLYSDRLAGTSDMPMHILRKIFAESVKSQ